MSELDDLINSWDISKLIAPSGKTYGEELVAAANLLRDCIQDEINRGSMVNCISTADIADIKIDGSTLSIELKIQNALRPSIFARWNGAQANVFWLLNDGFTVKKDVWFKNIPNFGYRKAESFVERGIAKFNEMNSLGVTINVQRPLLYYGQT